MQAQPMILFLMLLAAAYGCASQNQGITGKVLWIEGNQMPGPGRKSSEPQPVMREIYIYEPVTEQQAKNSNGFYTEIQTPLIAKATSNADGSFTVALPPGEYSVFTKEPEGLFASIFDQKGRINVISVPKHEFTSVTLRINYNATY
jgi:hypothetical protein